MLRALRPRPVDLSRAGLAIALICLAITPFGRRAAAQDLDAGPEPTVAHEVDPRATDIRALIAQTLDPRVEPADLFDVALDDEAGVQLEARRLRLLLAASDAGPEPVDGALDASVTHAEANARWLARLSLDRARLDFYELPAAQRQALLRSQAERHAASSPRESDAQRKAREAHAEREHMLESARAARSEAERLVRQEYARLLSLVAQTSELRAQLAAASEELSARRATVFGWQRRMQDARTASPLAADATYTAARRYLRTARDDLSSALDDLDSAASAVPEIGPDPLQGIPAEISLDAVRAQRNALAALMEQARSEERALRRERAETLLDAIILLNRERLGLLEYLSTDTRAAITGFTRAGFDQARSEARQLHLIARYHFQVAAAFLGLRPDETRPAVSVWSSAAFAVPWLLLVLVFSTWRRKSKPALAFLDQRLLKQERLERRVEPSPMRRLIAVLESIERPLSWLVFFAITRWLLPPSARELLEVQLLSVVVSWTLGTAIAVNVIDQIARGTSRSSGDAGSTEQLRLRSLRMVGRVIVGFVLILVLSSRLVGEGTIYSWVSVTFWLAAIPVFLVLVRWWRVVVFARIERIRRKTAFQSWMLANREGWKSFIVAMFAAVQLFALGMLRAARTWISRFELARRIHAYLFRRELSRIDEQQDASTRPLADPTLSMLDPNRAHERWIQCPADHVLSDLRERVASKHGGAVAIVGARGRGKSALLRQFSSELTQVVAFDCTAFGQRSASESLAARLPPNEEVSAVVLDDAHALVKPLLGGLAVFDDVLALARSQRDHTLWVFAIDDVIWPFIRRARDARPLFDRVYVLESWSEDQLAQLLLQRSQQAGFSPLFDDLLDRLPPAADEIDRQEAIASRRAAYFRMLWDYVSGNPGMALEAWRSALVRADDDSVRVKALQAPDPRALDPLPDASLFVLRAVLQMPLATVRDIALATRLTESQVQNAIRFGEGPGYFLERDARIEVPWRWRRAVLSLLYRRQLLVTP